MRASHDTSRALYLELAANGADLRTEDVEPVIRTLADVARCERLLARVRTHRDQLSALIAGQGDRDLDAIRQEARRD